MKIHGCKYCGQTTHYSVMCYQRPRKAIKKVSKKTDERWIETKTKWFDANLPDKDGFWDCYLRIAASCPQRVDRRTLNLEHVKSRARNPHLKFDPSNLRPACGWCNQLKGSLDLDEVLELYGKM